MEKMEFKVPGTQVSMPSPSGQGVKKQESPLLSQNFFKAGISLMLMNSPHLLKDPTKIDAMYLLLSDLTDDEFRKAMAKFMLMHKEVYPNTNVVAYLREYALIDEELPTPEEAWGEVKAYFGPAHSPMSEFTSQALHILGRENVKWNLIRNENEEIDRAHFFKTYKAITERAKNELLMGDR